MISKSISISRDGIFRSSKTSDFFQQHQQKFDPTNPQHVYIKLTDLSSHLSSQEKIGIVYTLLNRQGGFDVNQPLNSGVPCDQEYRLFDSAFDCQYEEEKPDEEFAGFLVRCGADPFLCKHSIQSVTLFDSMKKLFPLLAIEKQLTELSPNESEELSTKSGLYNAYILSILGSESPNAPEIAEGKIALFVPPIHIDLAVYLKIIEAAIGKSVEPVKTNQISSLIEAANYLHINNALTIRNLVSDEDLNSFIKTHPNEREKLLELFARLETTTDDSIRTATWLAQILVTIAICYTPTLIKPSNKQAIQDMLNNISNIDVSKEIQCQIAMLGAIIGTHNNDSNNHPKDAACKRKFME